MLFMGIENQKAEKNFNFSKKINANIKGGFQKTCQITEF